MTSKKSAPGECLSQIADRRALAPCRVALIFILVTFIFTSGCQDSRRGIYPGETAPDVLGVDLDGHPLSLHSVKGQVLLVNFWATWCGPCIAELPALQSLHDKLKDRGFRVVGVAIDDSPENIREAVSKNHITYPVVLDEEGKSKRKFEIKGMPESFVLDAEHKVLVIQDPADGTPVTKIIGPREWDQIHALQAFQALVQ